MMKVEKNILQLIFDFTTLTVRAPLEVLPFQLNLDKLDKLYWYATNR